MNAQVRSEISGQRHGLLSAVKPRSALEYKGASDTDEEGALRIAEQVHIEVARQTVVAGSIDVGPVTVSIGMASTARAGEAKHVLTELYRQADAALYQTKARGRNQTWRADMPLAPLAS